jgi:hypothetical protein
MRNYLITYSILGSGQLIIRAKNEELAEDILFDMSTEDLLSEADFSDSLRLDLIESY